ncbi:hypothetical protein Tco_1045011 [Tanacetum coccineum]|uniref:Uncharacterized protein n=1 Tax=Tanacetum coccineum TaxID=301880 RepID=A0ABQ5GRI7_9ASTR
MMNVPNFECHDLLLFAATWPICFSPNLINAALRTQITNTSDCAESSSGSGCGWYFPTTKQHVMSESMGSYTLDRENSGIHEMFTRMLVMVGTALSAAGMLKGKQGIFNTVVKEGTVQQENIGRHDRGFQHEYRGLQDQNVEHQGDRQSVLDSKTTGSFAGSGSDLLVGMGMRPQCQVTTTRRPTQGSSNLGILISQCFRSPNQGGHIETLPRSNLFVQHVEELIHGVCYKANWGCFSTPASTHIRRRIVLQCRQKQNMPTDFARLPPTTGRVYATTRDQAAKTSGFSGFCYGHIFGRVLHIENLSVVREIADVFPDELPDFNFPPAREINLALS